ncbi:hypothetical protein HC256_004387 [Beauveria bassiana]|nr:hypothetical protein HC256_004387 [Beauveria bassiana]
MKFSLATIALAAAVVASPTNPPTEAGSCNVKGKTGNVTCCNSAIPILGQLLCNVLASGTCNSGQSAYCCDTGDFSFVIGDIRHRQQCFPYKDQETKVVGAMRPWLHPRVHNASIIVIPLTGNDFDS